MSDLRQRLAALPPRPWRIDKVTDAEVAPGFVVTVGAIRSADNRNVIEPSPESSSMLVSRDDVMQFIADSPSLIEELLDMLDGSKVLDE